MLQDGHAPPLQVPHFGAGHGGLHSSHSHQDHNLDNAAPLQQQHQEGASEAGMDCLQDCLQSFECRQTNRSVNKQNGNLIIIAQLLYLRWWFTCKRLCLI